MIILFIFLYFIIFIYKILFNLENLLDKIQFRIFKANIKDIQNYFLIIKSKIKNITINYY